MCKSEIFAKIINIVSKETEVSVDQILSSDKKMETVDARYLLVSLHYVNIAEREWKNNNRTEAFFDLLELPFLQNSREIIYINPIKLYILII